MSKIDLGVHYAITTLRKTVDTLWVDKEQVRSNPAANFEYVREKHNIIAQDPVSLDTVLGQRIKELEKALNLFSIFGGYVVEGAGPGEQIFTTKEDLDKYFESLEDLSDIGEYTVYPLFNARYGIEVEREYGRDDITISSRHSSTEEEKYDLFWTREGRDTQENRDLSERELQDEIAELLSDGICHEDIWVEKKITQSIGFRIDGEPVVRVTYTEIPAEPKTATEEVDKF
jgi:hypothetical protein